MEMRIRIDVTGFAKIQNATVYIDDLMMFVGDNNSGKTLLMELIYGVVDFISKYKVDCTNVKIAKTEYVSYFRFASEWFETVENEINQYLQENLNIFMVDVFNASIPMESLKVCFEDMTEVFYIATISDRISLEKQYHSGQREIVFQDEEIDDDVMDFLAHRVLNDIIGIRKENKQLFVPAARAGLQMLYRYMFTETTGRNAGLPLPIAEYLNFIQTYTVRSKISSEKYSLIEFIEDKLLSGKVDYNNGQFFFLERDNVIPLNFASSMIHELSVLSSILKSDQNIDLIYYDEIENSVHPLLQGEVARALVRFCNLGKKLIISTHSDTMAGKLNNIILLSRMHNPAMKNRKIQKIGYDSKDMLDEDKNIGVYEFIKNEDGKVRVEKLEFMSYPKIGYDFERFNENINQLYEESNLIMED